MLILIKKYQLKCENVPTEANGYLTQGMSNKLNNVINQ